MIISLTTLLAILSSILRSRTALQLENLVLRQQIGVLHRSARKRPKRTSADRLLWIFLSRFWRDWRSALATIKPETDLAWHRAGFRCISIIITDREHIFRWGRTRRSHERFSRRLKCTSLHTRARANFVHQTRVGPRIV
jgi:hypothetical protein